MGFEEFLVVVHVLAAIVWVVAPSALRSSLTGSSAVATTAA